MRELASDVEPFWVPPGDPVTIAGRTVPGGFLYVGQNLGALRSSGGVEPALIDPALSADTAALNDPSSRKGIPSYSEMSLADRARYLDWLAGGRADPEVDPRYVMLNFFALERRLLADYLKSQRARNETPVLLHEVERLLGLYGSHAWFRRQAEELVALLYVVRGYRKAYQMPPPDDRPTDTLHVLTRIGLSQLVFERRAVPAAWALAWLAKDPSSRFRTSYETCPDDFCRLFEIRYAEIHGSGFVLEVRKRRAEDSSDLQAAYLPASPSFDRPVRFTFDGLPDVTTVSNLPRAIRSLADDCAADLSEYSRCIERLPRSRWSLAASTFLPEQLLSEAQALEHASLPYWLGGCLETGECMLLDAEGLVRRLFVFAPDRVGKREALRTIELLQEAGFGIEPDVRFSGCLFTSAGVVSLFRLVEGSSSGPSRSYAATAALLHLAVAIAGADDDVTTVEVQKLEEHLARHLPESERPRLLAHLRWLENTRPRLGRIKDRLELLDRAERETIARFLIALAGADGHVTNEETKLLAKIYPLLGLDPDDIYGHILGLSVEVARSSREEPPTLKEAEARPEFSIPQLRQEGQGFRLDAARIQEQLGQTEAVSSLLSEVFQEVGQSHSATIVSDLLDHSHVEMVRALVGRPSWSRAEIERVARGLGIMTDGALERINERAWEVCGAPAWEGEDPLQVHEAVMKELMR